ncbi:MAG: aromatic amino acid ammonia-lyase [bacterium]|nr:aromatic amino acid ammonia-lyase [bacterium]
MNHAPTRLLLTEHPVSLLEFLAALQPKGQVGLSPDPTYRGKLEKSAQFVADSWKQNREIYGVTTGYGASVGRAVDPALIEELPLHLTRFHGCGTGRYFEELPARAIVLARLISLAKGWSGVRVELLERLAELFNRNLLPRIPEEGSVGASGDLTPLSYLAALLLGEREALVEGQVVSAAEALAQAGLTPLKLVPKEALSMMNGTSVMTALTALAWERAERLQRVACRITAMNVIAYRGNPAHFDARIFEAKPHPGQARAAAWIAQDLDYHQGEPLSGPKRLQDPYSLRCAPHVIGVLGDALDQFVSWIEVEINSANDNPLVDAEAGEFLHGGNFYGGHMAFVADGLKNAVANLADLLDRQMALLVDERFNHGLPANLSGATPERASINHGFKALQIAVSAWTAEALKLTMPASVFSRSTECHNQDKVSMGTIAARDCLRILELTEQVAAAVMMAAQQGLRLRQRAGDLGDGELGALSRFMDQLSPCTAFVDEDRPLEAEIRCLTAALADGTIDPYRED